MVVALAGNQNSGKTTLFNLLTGGSARVGNFPGVTVEKKTGRLRGHTDWEVVDLPGLYSLNAYTEEEEVSRRCLTEGKIDAVIDVVDAKSPARGLYLTLQLLELGVPVTVALNMEDELESAGGKADADKLSELLGTPAVCVSALTGVGTEELVKRALSAKPPNRSSVGHTSFDAEVEERYRRVGELCARAFTLPGKTAAQRRSDAIDRVVMNRFLALPVFLLIMAAVFWLSFSVAGRALSGLLARLVAVLGKAADKLLSGAPATLASFVSEGLLGGIGTVVSFLPTIVAMLFLLSLLEDTGYLARVTYATDRLFSRFGLSGRAAVPLLMGLGCSVPAVLATRTLQSSKDKQLTARMIPCVSCSAKMSVYALLCGALFSPLGAAGAIVYLYLLGFGAAALSANMFGKSKSEREGDFLLELPVYRFPSVSNVLLDVKRAAGDFVKKLFTAVMLATAAVWALSRLGPGFAPAEGSESLLALAGGVLAAILRPAGFGDWRAAAALLCGLAAKESIVSSLFALGAGAEIFTPLSALSFLTFVALYSPCAATLLALRRTAGRKTAVTVFLLHNAAAYLCAVAVYQAGRLALSLFA